MALIRDFEIQGTGVVVPNAYHIISKVHIEKRTADIPAPPDTSRADGLTNGGHNPGTEVYWKAGYVAEIAVDVYKDAAARASGSNPIGFVGVNPADNAHGASIGTEGMDHHCRFFVDTNSTASHLEQAYNHLLTTQYYTGSLSV